MLAMQAEQQARNSLAESYSFYAQRATAQLAAYNQQLRTAATGAGAPLPGLVPGLVPQHARRMPPPAPPPEMDMLTTRLLSSRQSGQFGWPTVADPATEEKTGMAIMGLVNRDRNM
jgi:hypothetical protein